MAYGLRLEALPSHSIVHELDLFLAPGLEGSTQGQYIKYLVDWDTLVVDAHTVSTVAYEVALTGAWRLHELFLNEGPLVIYAHLTYVPHEQDHLLSGIIEYRTKVNEIGVEGDVGEV